MWDLKAECHTYEIQKLNIRSSTCKDSTTYMCGFSPQITYMTYLRLHIGWPVFFWWRPMYLLIVGSHYCVMCFACALHMCRQNLVIFPCLYFDPFELALEIIFHYCTMPPCHKINLFKSPFRGSRYERLDDAFVLLVSLIFFYPQKILISVRWPLEL